jgi:hypothetical protein
MSPWMNAKFRRDLRQSMFASVEFVYADDVVVGILDCQVSGHPTSNEPSASRHQYVFDVAPRLELRGANESQGVVVIILRKGNASFLNLGALRWGKGGDLDVVVLEVRHFEKFGGKVGWKVCRKVDLKGGWKVGESVLRNVRWNVRVLM